MNTDVLVVNSIAAILIVLVLWWFFGSIPRAAMLDNDEPILVMIKDGVYQPAFIQVHAGKSIKLHFLREDATPCSESVSFPQLNASYPLPMHQVVEVTLPPLVAGELDFTCQMGMYRGKIIIA